MEDRAPGTETLTVPEVRDQLDGLVERVGREETRVLVAKDGRPVAAIVSTEELERLVRWAEDREAWQVLAAMRASLADAPPEEIERETDRIVAENRLANRQRRQASGS